MSIVIINLAHLSGNCGGRVLNGFGNLVDTVRCAGHRRSGDAYRSDTFAIFSENWCRAAPDIVVVFLIVQCMTFTTYRLEFFFQTGQIGDGILGSAFQVFAVVEAFEIIADVVGQEELAVGCAMEWE